jgi:hypothetical protein
MMLGQVYGHDAEARERSLTPDERLQNPIPFSGQVHRCQSCFAATESGNRRSPANGT